jgi:hypothetical protein
LPAKTSVPCEDPRSAGPHRCMDLAPVIAPMGWETDRSAICWMMMARAARILAHVVLADKPPVSGSSLRLVLTVGSSGNHLRLADVCLKLETAYDRSVATMKSFTSVSLINGCLPHTSDSPTLLLFSCTHCMLAIQVFYISSLPDGPFLSFASATLISGRVSGSDN